MSKLSRYLISIISIITFSYPFSGEANTSTQIDSLFKIWNTISIKDTIRMEALTQVLFDRSWTEKYRDSTKVLAEKLFETAMKNNSKKYQIRSLYLKAKYQTNTSGFSKSIQLYNQSLKLAEEINDNAGQGSAYSGLAIISYQADDKSNFFLNQKKSLYFWQKTQSENDIAWALHNMGYAYQETGNYDTAIFFYKKSLILAEKIGFHEAIANCLTYLGESYQLKGEYLKAQDYFKQSLKVKEEHRITNEINWTMVKMGEGFIILKSYQKAAGICQKAYDAAMVKKEDDAIRYSCKCLYESYKALGNVKGALFYYERWISLNDSIDKVEITKQLQQANFSQQLLLDRLSQLEEKRKVEADYNENMKDAKLVRNGFVAGFIIVLLFATMFFSQRNKIRKGSEELQIAKEKAEQSEKFKQQFLANMSHEIRTPMNAVMGMTELVLNSDLNEKQRKYLETVKKSSGNLLHIINDILDLSKIEAGKIELEKIDFSVREMIQQVKDILNSKAKEKNLLLFATVDASVPEVLIGDPMRLTQVLMNLTGNAIKFTEKGSVTIKLGIKNEELRMNGEPQICNLKFEIIDTGIGIPQEKLSTIFESFSQAHLSDSRKYGGTGLGLTISKQFIELMEGELIVESVEGSGTTFYFEMNLPVGSKENLLQQNFSEAIDGSILNGLRILLVDDNEDNRIVAADLLQSRCELHIEEAANGEEAIAWLSKNDFDIVLMDVQMPVMDGYTATKEIRNAQSTVLNHNIPVIALTASVIRSDLDKCREAGMNDYVPKPFKISQLISAIAKLTGKELKFIESKEPILKNNYLPPTVADLSYLYEFCEGDKVRMKKFIGIFLESAPMLIKKLNIALAEQNYKEIATQVHGYKTNLIMMGMDDASDLAAEIEIKCRQLPVDNYTALRIVDLVKQIEKATENLSQLIV